MPYSAQINRSNPTCFLFLVDQSGSMADRFGPESTRTKAEGVADALNRLVQTLVLRCSKGEYVLDRYYVGVIGYGGEIGLGFPSDALAGEVLCPVSLVSRHPLRVEDRVKREDDGAGGLIERRAKFPVWFEPRAEGKTPMCTALQTAQELIAGFVQSHPSCFPPITINISDGAATDGDPEGPAAALRNVASRDGNALLFNLHISARNEKPILFPVEISGLPDEHAKLLFRMSSPLPREMLRQARIIEHTIPDRARGFGFNADLASVIMFLNIGTRVDVGFG